MRSDQWMGKTEAGHKYLARFELEFDRVVTTFWSDPHDPQGKLERSTTHGWTIPEWRMKESRTVEGAYVGVAGVLYEFLIVDGDGKVVEYAREDIQEEIWSSGPCYFIALKDKQGEWIKETLWSGGAKELSEA